MSKATPFIAFIFGAVSGAAVSWFLTKKEYQKRLDQVMADVNSVSTNETEDVVSEKVPYAANINLSGVIPKSSINVVEAAKIMTENHYVPPVPDIPKHDGPYIITPDEFGDYYDYSKVFLNLFADNVVADSSYDILTPEDIEDTIGFDSLEHIGEYETDLIHVRNDAKHCDYEVTRDYRNYCDLGPNEL